MKWMYAAALILLLVCLINYGVDLVFYLKDRFSRFHIGRWTRETWEGAVERRAIKWLHRTPVVKITDNSRYVLLDMLTGKYRSHTIQSWQKAALMLGLWESGKNNLKDEAKRTAEVLFDQNGSWRRKPTRVDCGMLSYAALETADDPQSIMVAMDESVAVIQNSINENGLISYTGQKNNPEMYVDTLGLCCPFLVLYAKTYNQIEYEELAFEQIKAFRKNGILSGSELPNHAYNLKCRLPLGVYGWGRGIGWYVIGLVDSYENMTNEEYRAELKTWIHDAAEEYKQFQRSDGGFGAIVQSAFSYDSSATAVLAWFYAKCWILFGVDEYRLIAEKCLNKLLKCTRRTGAIDWCQGDTKGIGVFSQTYDVMPFVQGMALRAIYSLKN